MHAHVVVRLLLLLWVVLGLLLGLKVSGVLIISSLKVLPHFFIILTKMRGLEIVVIFLGVRRVLSGLLELLGAQIWLELRVVRLLLMVSIWISVVVVFGSFLHVIFLVSFIFYFELNLLLWVKAGLILCSLNCV